MKFWKDSKKIINYKKFINKNKNYSYIKNQLLFLFLFIFGLSFVLLAFFGYYNQSNYFNDLKNDLNTEKIDPHTWTNLKGMPLKIRAIRSVMNLVLVWYLFITIWSFKNGINIFLINKKLAYLYFFNFTIVVSIFAFLYNLKSFNKKNFYLEIKNFFRSDPLLKAQFKFSNWKRWLILIEWIIFSPLIIWILFPNSEINNTFEVDWINNFFFYTIYYFTIEANLVCFSFLTFLLIYPQWKIFRNNSFQILSTSFIMLVCSIWSVFLLPNFIYTNEISQWSKHYYISTFWLHIINPLTFLVFSIVLLLKTEKKLIEIQNQSVILFVIYPLMYSLFIILLPFTSGVSVYGWATNLNSKLAVFQNFYSNTYYFGKWWYIFLILLTNILVTFYSYFFTYISYKNKNLI